MNILFYICFKLKTNIGGLMRFILISIALLVFIGAFLKSEDSLDIAYSNAKKGYYWALANIPERKSRIDNDLIADDKLIASIKLFKEVNGVKIESTGFHLTNQVKIVIYKSYDSLMKEGFIEDSAKHQEIIQE